jgi:hypothetical protein
MKNFKITFFLGVSLIISFVCNPFGSEKLKVVVNNPSASKDLKPQVTNASVANNQLIAGSILKYKGTKRITKADKTGIIAVSGVKMTIIPTASGRGPDLAEIADSPTVNSRIPSDDLKQSFYWEVSPSLSWKSLSSTDENIYRSSQINALSNTNYGASFSYGMHFEENIDIYSKLFLESVNFAQDSSINLLQKKFLASSFSVGFFYERKWLLEFAMSDLFFLTSPSLSSVDIKKVTLPEIKLTYLKDFYQYREAKLSYSLSGNVFLPRMSSEVKSKLGYGAGGALETKLRNQSFIIGFDLNFLKANDNSTEYQNIYWKYIWETL